ncbi:hypothetical protein BLNAU_8880 [Blattamonas nauphoetae]|uniref:UBC core domain-containing protein n=1 Tax=Blattamonas nauphoetae TaxID=2049346 RepID=A0ABQ9XX90_9EUKA|nr:hypothetical protein BLNAU_8880 [Blattamonas nauphoetae]
MSNQWNQPPPRGVLLVDEMEELETNPPNGIMAGLEQNDDDPSNSFTKLKWNVMILDSRGNEATYQMTVPNGYPSEPPHFTRVSGNISPSSPIEQCPYLQSWNSSKRLKPLLEAIRQLFPK